MERYKLVDIQVKHLSVVWVNAQRPYNEKWAQTIADNFDPDKFDPLVVTKADGLGVYHVIEGQHRRHALQKFAAKLDGTSGENEYAPCRVVDDADPERAAEIWLGINKGRKAIKPVHEFKVAVTAEREIEVDINRIVIKVGYKVSATKAQYTISAVSALRMVYNVHSPLTLERTLRLLSDLWGGDPAAVSAPLLRGFGMFVNEFHGSAQLKRLRQQIGERFTPWKFRDAADARRKNTLEKLDEAIAENIIREYNKGLPSKSCLRHKQATV